MHVRAGLQIGCLVEDCPLWMEQVCGSFWVRRKVGRECSVWRYESRRVSMVVSLRLERKRTVVGRASKRSVEWWSQVWESLK